MITIKAENEYLALQNEKESNAKSYPRHFPIVIENLLDDCESGIAAPCGMIFETVQGEGGAIPANIHATYYRRKRHSINYR